MWFSSASTISNALRYLSHRAIAVCGWSPEKKGEHKKNSGDARHFLRQSDKGIGISNRIRDHVEAVTMTTIPQTNKIETIAGKGKRTAIRAAIIESSTMTSLGGFLSNMDTLPYWAGARVRIHPTDEWCSQEWWKPKKNKASHPTHICFRIVKSALRLGPIATAFLSNMLGVKNGNGYRMAGVLSTKNADPN